MKINDIILEADENDRNVFFTPEQAKAEALSELDPERDVTDVGISVDRIVPVMMKYRGRMNVAKAYRAAHKEIYDTQQSQQTNQSSSNNTKKDTPKTNNPAPKARTKTASSSSSNTSFDTTIQTTDGEFDIEDPEDWKDVFGWKKLTKNITQARGDGTFKKLDTKG